MVTDLIEPGLQAQKGASFWDTFYGTAPLALQSSATKDACVADNTGTGEGQGSVAEAVGTRTECAEWILEPSVALPASVLELGCGDSCLALKLYDALSGDASVTGIDVSEVALAHARDRSLLDGPRPRLRFLCADALELGAFIQDDTVDLVLDKGMSDTLQFRARTKDSRLLRTKLFSAVFRALVPGGLYVIMTPKCRVRYLRTAAWEHIDRETTSHDGSLLVRARPVEEVYIHVCRKPGRSAGAESDITVSPDMGSARPVTTAETNSFCDCCGVHRLPRYRSEKSWARHTAWCATARPP